MKLFQSVRAHLLYVFVGSGAKPGDLRTEGSCPFWLNASRDSPLTSGNVAAQIRAGSAVREFVVCLNYTDIPHPSSVAPV